MSGEIYIRIYFAIAGLFFMWERGIPIFGLLYAKLCPQQLWFFLYQFPHGTNEQTNYVAVYSVLVCDQIATCLIWLSQPHQAAPYNFTENKPDKSRTIYQQITNTQRKYTGRYAFFLLFPKNPEIGLNGRENVSPQDKRKPIMRLLSN